MSDFYSSLEKLKELHDEHIYAPDQIVRYGRQAVLEHGKQKNLHAVIGNQAWDIYERVLVAALMESDDELASYCLAQLKKKFSEHDSRRLRRLVALNYEHHGQYEQAKEYYQTMLELDPSDVYALKRLASISAQTGHDVAAVSLLVQSLNILSADVDCWQQLANMYLCASNYDLAKFCFEELLTLVPENTWYHTQYAEVLYTMKDFEISRKYFAQAVELHPDNVRALNGIIQCVKAAPSHKLKPIYDFANAELRRIYSNAPEPARSAALSIL